MNEAETRTHYILPALKKAGWGVNGSKIREEFPVNKGRLIGDGKRAKADSADYVLQYKKRSLAVIEAKKDEFDYTEGVAQAKKYAERLGIRYAYSTNGKKIYAIDRHTGKEVRRIWSEEEWFYSVVDIIEVLTYSPKSRQY